MEELSRSKETHKALRQVVESKGEETRMQTLTQRKDSEAGQKHVSLRESASSIVSARELAMSPDKGDLLVPSDKKQMIRVEIAQTTGRNKTVNQDTIKTTSQMRDYSLEDGGGIFEKKTIIANTSLEEGGAHIGEDTGS